ncbi:MAG: hypothetical protein JW966_04635 [Anaerolineae bacterium]|nr:hypothetical protein [Anaerolineae bacterium]
MPDPNKGQSSKRPSPSLDDIPVEELLRITREFTRRVTNQDRQRLALALHESGHHRLIKSSAPLILQQFFSGEIDLDTQLEQRFANAPLLSHAHFINEPCEPVCRQATAVLSCQDDSATIMIDALLTEDNSASVTFTFTLFSALALRFLLDPLLTEDRRDWLDLMRRENGITLLWTRQRWEQPYLIFVVREYYARVYAFSPYGFEAAVRMTPDAVTEMLDWLDALWFPDQLEHVPPAVENARPRLDAITRSALSPAQLEAAHHTPEAAHPASDEPEEQWGEPGDALSSDVSGDSSEPLDMLEW